MFGLLRLVLALMVAWYHLFHQEFAGPLAVFGFYCLSGYLMTRIVNTTYSDGVGGFGRYLANRALRIYPLYLVVVAITAVAVLALPSAVERFPPDLFEPANLTRSLIIFGLRWDSPTFVLPAWSLSVELLHYIAIGALLGRSRLVTVLWFAIGIAIPIISAIQGLPWPWIYFDPLASTVAFAIGAMIWHFRNHLPRSHAGVGAVAIMLLAVLGMAMSTEFGSAGGIYIGLAISAAAVIALRDLRETPFGQRCGHLAYPIFLIHVPAKRIVGAAIDLPGYEALISFLLTVALSFIAVRFIDVPIERLRTGLRRPAPEPLPQ